MEQEMIFGRNFELEGNVSDGHGVVILFGNAQDISNIIAVLSLFGLRESFGAL